MTNVADRAKKRLAVVPHSAWAGLITLLAFALRLHNLTYHSLWFDEAVSLRWAQSSVATILDVSMHLVEDRLPPLYYLLLKGWGGLAGFSEFSVRWPSVVLGVLLVPVVYGLGRRLFDGRAGLVAALLAAGNPFLIWYSQEARMYAAAVLFGAAGVLCFWLAIEGAGRRRALAWAGLGIFALAGLYTHLYTGFLWPALAIWLLLNPARLKRAWLAFGLTMGAVSVLFAPLAWANWRFSGESQPGDPLAGLGGRLVGLFKAFVVWQAPLDAATERWVLLVLGAFLLAGVGLALRSARGRLVIGLLVMPLIVAGVLTLRSDLAFFGERYFIVMLPWLVLLQGLVVSRLSRAPGGRWLGLVAGVALVAATLRPLPGQWSASAAKEAWRQTTAYMTTHVQPGDGVFIHPEWIRFPYQYYAAQMGTPGQTYAAFFAVDAQTDLDGPLTGILNDHPVIWLIESHIDEPDPDRRVENWFAARYPLVTELYPPGVVLKAFAPGYQMTALPPDAAPVAADFATGIRLAGATVFDARLPAAETLFHPPSNWIHVALYWSPVDGASPQDAMPFVHLVDELGQVWGASLERGNDAVHIFPPSRWEAGQVIRHDVDVNLNPATPPGRYRLVAGVGEESVVLGDVEISEQ